MPTKKNPYKFREKLTMDSREIHVSTIGKTVVFQFYNRTTEFSIGSTQKFSITQARRLIKLFKEAIIAAKGITL